MITDGPVTSETTAKNLKPKTATHITIRFANNSTLFKHHKVITPSMGPYDPNATEETNGTSVVHPEYHHQTDLAQMTENIIYTGLKKLKRGDCDHHRRSPSPAVKPLPFLSMQAAMMRTYL